MRWDQPGRAIIRGVLGVCGGVIVMPRLARRRALHELREVQVLQLPLVSQSGEPWVCGAWGSLHPSQLRRTAPRV
jgi:hypothetical protein